MMTIHVKQYRFVAVLSGLLLMMTACNSAETPSDSNPAPERSGANATLDAALEEGEVTWYGTPYSLDTTNAVAAAFEKAYPGIKVNVFREATGAVLQRFTQESESGRHVADVFAVSDLQVMNQLKTGGYFEKYEPRGEERMSANLREGSDPDGFYHIMTVGHNVISYNTRLVSEAEAPRTWEDLLDAKWKDQISTGNPGASGYVKIWAVEMQLLYGADYAEQLAAQNVLVGQSINDTVPRVASGERMIGVSADATVAPSILKGDPIAVIYPEDGAVAVTGAAALVKDAPHPNAAKLFYDFLYTDATAEVYKSFGVQSVIEGTEQPEYIPASFDSISPTPEEMDEHSETVVQLWRELFGV